jgi:hypothetical protein
VVGSVMMETSRWVKGVELNSKRGSRVSTVGMTVGSAGFETSGLVSWFRDVEAGLETLALDSKRWRWV